MVIPRVLISAATSSAGKTTVAMGLMAALSESLTVAPFKTGPDYIDPTYHGLATDRVGRNLDAHLCGEDLMVPLFLAGSRGADIAVIEGAMGLFDGRLGTDGFGSAAHIARLLDAPVIVVVDASHTARSAAAVALGLAHYDSRIRVAGVIANRAHGRLAGELERAVEKTGLPFLGALPTVKGVTAPSRHLGLVPTSEREVARENIVRAGELVATHIDLAAVREIAQNASPLPDEVWSPDEHVPTMIHDSQVADSPLVAVAGESAFTFAYPENRELLIASGAHVVDFDPLHDKLPSGTSGIYLGGGFPEEYASQLVSNHKLRKQIRDAVRDGVPTIAECAGLLYLCDSLDGIPMSGGLSLKAETTPGLTIGYHDLVAQRDSLVTRAGEKFASHEFHRTKIISGLDSYLDATAWAFDHRGQARVEGIATESLLATYQHQHWAGSPQIAQRFVVAAARTAGVTATPSDNKTNTVSLTDQH